MKPFDLKAALAGDPVVTRNGKKIAFLAHDPAAAQICRVLARAEDETYPYSFAENGAFVLGTESIRDLFMAPKKRTVWVNLYVESWPDYESTAGRGQPAVWHATEVEADRAAASSRIGDRAFPIEIEE